ncbi:MAG: hypothetical protein Kow00127_01420 [Bacteroidales bacterium]
MQIDCITQNIESMKPKTYLRAALLLLSVVSLLTVSAQNIAITDDDNYSPDNSAMLDVKSLDKGVLVPRMTTAQKLSISSPAEGLFVYDTDKKCMSYFNGTDWLDMPNRNIKSTDTTVVFNKHIGFEGDAVVWDDLKVPVTATKSFGAKAPTYFVFANDGVGSQGVYLWYFSPSQEQELFFTVQLPHSWKEGSTIEPHIHWTPYSTGGSGNVVWGLEYTWAKVGDNFNYTDIITGTSAVPTDIKHGICDLGSIDGTGKTYSSMLVCRVFRDATNPADTYDDYVCLLEIDFHIQKTSLGTQNEF